MFLFRYNKNKNLQNIRIDDGFCNVAVPCGRDTGGKGALCCWNGGGRGWGSSNGLFTLIFSPAGGGLPI